MSAAPEQSATEPRHPEVRNIPDQLPRGLILRVMLATVMITVALCFATYLYDRLRMLQLRPSGAFPEQALPPPHEVAHVRQELFQIPHPRPTSIDRDRAVLQSAGWVDRQRRIVHVPVDLAIELVARRAGPGGAQR
ncbi:MAG: hypothetical protein ACJ8F1_06965 [Polyangia bacterium]